MLDISGSFQLQFETVSVAQSLLDLIGCIGGVNNDNYNGRSRCLNKNVT